MLLDELVEALAVIGRSRCDLGQCDQVTLRRLVARRGM
jgi:hypothetical protein